MEVLREREREILRQIKAPNRRNTGSISRFGNAELAEKIRPRRGLTFATGSWVLSSRSVTFAIDRVAYAAYLLGAVLNGVQIEVKNSFRATRWYAGHPACSSDLRVPGMEQEGSAP